MSNNLSAQSNASSLTLFLLEAHHHHSNARTLEIIPWELILKSLSFFLARAVEIPRMSDPLQNVRNACYLTAQKIQISEEHEAYYNFFPSPGCVQEMLAEIHALRRKILSAYLSFDMLCNVFEANKCFVSLHAFTRSCFQEYLLVLFNMYTAAAAVEITMAGILA